MKSRTMSRRGLNSALLGALALASEGYQRIIDKVGPQKFTE